MQQMVNCGLVLHPINLDPLGTKKPNGSCNKATARMTWHTSSRRVCQVSQAYRTDPKLPSSMSRAKPCAESLLPCACLKSLKKGLLTTFSLPCSHTSCSSVCLVLLLCGDTLYLQPSLLKQKPKAFRHM